MFLLFIVNGLVLSSHGSHYVLFHLKNCAGYVQFSCVILYIVTDKVICLPLFKILDSHC